MQSISAPNKEKLLNDIKIISQTLDDIIEKLDKKPQSNMEENLWDLRADMEMLVVGFKMVLEKEDEKEKWQKMYLENLKGTSSRTKAINILKETIMDQHNTIAIYNKNISESYKYFWKLKETISAVMSAFEEKKRKTSSTVDDSDIFEI